VYLADVKPRDHADTGGMTFFDDLAKFIALQIRRGRWQASWTAHRR
jgi:hypothetical protein